jgi:hypothetical protein
VAGDIFDQAAQTQQNNPPPAAAPPKSNDIFDQAEQSQQQSSPMNALSKATSIGAGPSWFAQKWDEIKAGLAGAQEGGGLPKQPTALGNAAQFAGMVGTEAGQLGIGPGLAEGASAIQNAIPSAEKAGQTFQELKGAIGNHTVAVTDRMADTLSEIKSAVDTGSTLPSVINKFVTRIADTDEGPLTYKEARQFYSNVSDLSASEKMASKGKDLRLINMFKYALGDSISQTADSAGRLQDYQQAMSQYSSAKKIENAVETAKEIATKAGITAATGAAGYAGYRAIRDIFGQ